MHKMNNHNSNMRLTTSDAQCKAIKKGDVFRLTSEHCDPVLVIALDDPKIIGFATSSQISISIHLVAGETKDNPYVYNSKHDGMCLVFHSFNCETQNPIMIELISKLNANVAGA